MRTDGQVYTKGIGWQTLEWIERHRQTSPSSVYALVDPRTDAIRYIGHTCLPLDDRLNAHVSEAINGKGPARRRDWLRDLYAAGLRPLMVELHATNWVDGHALEERTIAEYAAAGHDLVNVRGIPRPLAAIRQGSQRQIAVSLSSAGYAELEQAARGHGLTVRDYAARLLERACGTEQET